MQKPWKAKTIGWFTNVLVAVLVILTFLKWTSASKSNGFLRSDYSQEQASRNYYPAGYKRFRRGYGLRDEAEFGQFSSFGNAGSTDTFGTFRKGNVGGRKGSTRTFNNRAFPAFGGPDAFLSAANPEDEEEDSRGTSINFGASSGGFPGFGSSSSSWGKQTSTKGRPKGGGIKTSSAAKLPPPSSINFGGESTRFGGAIGSQFLFGGNGGKPNFGTTGGSPSFSSTANFGGQKPFFGNFGAANQGGRNPFPPSSSSKKTFSSGGAEGFPNPFPSPAGGAGTPFGSLGNLGSFSGKIEDLTGGKVVGPISNFPDLGSLDLNNLLEQLEPSTTTKKPIRKISEEDRNKVFSGGDDEESEEENDSFRIPLGFKEKEVNLGFPNPFARPKEKEEKPKESKSCDVHPEAPLNAALRCTSYAGCRVDCNSNYRTPDGDTRLYLKCEDGEWSVRGKDYSQIPHCEPVCDPPCQNEGICLAPDLCNCPDDWEGPTCGKSKLEKKCTNKPPTPLNTRIFCGKEECIARCIEGYDFGEGLTKLSFVCRKGDWIMRTPEVDKIPDCKPICDPECQNGGICLAPDICECSSEFRGPQCQYPISNCDPKTLGFNGGYNCTGEDMDFGCKLWCPEGISFNVPEASFYRCDYATKKWTPQPIPQCDYSFLFSTDEPFDHSEVVSYLTKPKPKAGTCFVWSGAHYKTFDGKVYSFESGCPYTLLQDASLGTFSVNLASEESCRGSRCPKILKIFTEGDQYILSSADEQPILTFRETSLAIPGQMNGIVSERVAHFVVVKLTGIGLTLKWDLKNLFVAEVSELLWNRTSGLCGRLDGIEDNDWGYSDGSSEASLSTFLKAWQATTVGAPCLEPLVTRESCSRNSAYKGNSFCSLLATDPKFEPCREIVDVTPYINACKWDFCSCENTMNPETCSCDSFAAFFRECTNNGGAVIGGWRSEELCPLKCEAGLEYKSCMPAIRPRCGQAADTAKPEFCVEGCDCPAGFVLDAGEKCIWPKECPCTYHNKTYYSGDTIPNDCNSCTCLSGEWVCTEVKCGSRCSVVGDPHYTTFDGRKYDFMGKCSYYLVKGGDFSIEAENVPCAGAISEAMNFPSSVISQFPSCTRSLTLRVPGTTVALKQGRSITINGEEITELPLWANGVFVKRASSLFIMVYLPNGIEVWWDGQTRAYVDAPADLRGLTGGLCGTFNDNQKDDFLTPEGDNEQNPTAFANKWKTSQKCSDMPLSEHAHPCDRHAQNKGLSEKYCSKLKSKLFAKCHLEVDPEQYYRDCIYDLCSCEAELSRCLCPVVAAYGKECARKGVLVDWRAKIRECGMHCSGGQKYQICGDSCSHSCYDLASNPDCRRKCVEGCNCPEGFSLDANEVCVPISQCPCVYEGQEFKPNYEMFQKGLDGSLKLCKCERAAWKCREPTDVEMASPEFFTEPQVECLVEWHEVYTGCMPAEEPNCLTMHLRPEEQADICRPGCRCDHGYVRDQDSHRCVPYAQCPCHHGGRSYHEGDAIVEECNTCTCESGVWACTENPCPATCTAWGDSHYKTFDGRMFDFHGTCDYMLAKGKKSRSDVFEVSIQNVPCGTNGVTCAKSLTLRVGSGEEQEIVQFSRNKPTPMKNLTRTIIREAGIFVFAEVADMGLELQWDKGTRAYVTLDPSWKGKSVKGLCGNYNGDENDDFRTPSGGTGEASAKIFGDSWRLQNYCPESILIKDTCALHPHRKVWASEKCATLKSAVFAACHSEVPVDPYIERCQFDACGCDTGGDCHCLCTAIAAYAHECNIHGVYTRWRTPDFCPMQCDESCEHYEPCIPTCPQETCDSFKEPQSTLCRQDSCVEGCASDVCPPGQVHKSATDHECVPKIDCEKKCLEIDGEVYMEGDIVSEDECHSCFCSKGKKMCKGTPCETTSPFMTESTADYSYRVSTPSLDLTTSPVDEKEDCRTGWTVWINQDHPIVYKKNSDIESIPEKVSETLPDRGHCSRPMYDDIRCRTVGEHRSTDSDTTCTLEEGLRCERPKGGAKGRKSCPDFEISLFCDCSKELPSTVLTTTPVTPTEPPPIVQPLTTPPTPDVPETCEQEGWTPWMNVHFPTKFGEFETLDVIRETEKICPGHYIKEVECRPVGGGALDPASSCDKKGAVCRNNGGLEYCRDYEIRVLCECRCQSGLGMENGQIPDSKISMSSGDPGSTGRLNSFAEWIPELKPGDELSNQWIQVDLEDQKEVTGVLTQGHSRLNAYVTTFAVQVSETGSQWEEIRDPDEDYAKRFSGNRNSFEVVENLFPKPVYVRYVRIIPLEMQSIPALRIELKGCNLTDPLIIPPPGKTASPGVSTPLSPLVELTTPLQPTCQDGWTQWMNSHTPSPGDWNDLENYKSLRLKYSFCDEASIQRVECRVSTIRSSLADSGQVDVVCNKNYGLQCVDELQREHCYDYEIRFFCDCSLTTPSSIPDSTTSVVVEKPEGVCVPDPNNPTQPHEKDCSKFYECQPMWSGHGKLVEKDCGPGTLYNPKTLVCDWPYVVEKIRPECKEKPDVTTDVTEPSCTDDFWTEWFNISHPDVDNGDFELIKNIRQAGLKICDQVHILDIQCQFYQKPPSRSYGKGSSKGRKFSKGRPKPDRYTSIVSDVSQSKDIGVSCTAEEGLVCRNDRQRGRNKCQDYSIRVLCSCEAKTATPLSTSPSAWPPTTPSEFANYTDVRTATPTTSPIMYNDYACPPGKYYEEFAVQCTRICIFYKQFLVQQGKCLDERELAPACVDENTGLACPDGFFLRDNSTCVSVANCNCMLPNGMSASPDRTFLVSDCEICRCSNNELECDNSKCYDKAKEFDCDEWSPWLSVSAPSGQGDMETLEILQRYHPDVCSEPEKIECREKESGKPHFLTGQKVICNTNTGFQCMNYKNPGGCKDYEVRIFCKCEDRHETKPVLTTIPSKKYYTTTPLPPLPGCEEPFWTEWFNVTHPRVKGGDYELIDVIIKNGLDICPKPYISKIECAFYKEVKTYEAISRKGNRKYAKGRPARLSTSTYELTDYTESDDMYVTCSKFSGLTCVNSLQAKSKKCQDYAIRVYCECEKDDGFDPKEEVTPAGIPSTTPYPGWPVVGETCEEPEKVRVECAIGCHMVCKFYEHYLKMSGQCASESDCAPACMELYQKSPCPEGLFMADNSTCVQMSDCNCRLPDGRSLPGGTKMQVSNCEWCECSDNELLCETKEGCREEPTEPMIETSSVPGVEVTEPMSTTSTVITTPPALSLIKIRCNEWTPWMNMKRTSDGDSQRIVDLRSQYEELCEKPLNISCRDAIAKLPAKNLGQVITCSTTEGLICRNEDNREDCYDYEVSLFCECDETYTDKVPDATSTTAPSVTTELVPCDAFSPWINQHKPWLEDGDTEFQTLEQLRLTYNFCLEGHISDIECLEASSGRDISINKGVRCDRNFGLRCKNSDQDSGVCYDFKIRYFCSCGTTIATRPTLIVPATLTPPSVCDPESYIDLLEFVDDSAFSATSSQSSTYGPASARLNDPKLHESSWIAKDANKDQYLQIDLGHTRTIYGVNTAGSPRSGNRVISFSLMVSDDSLSWANVNPPVLRGPATNSEEKLALLSGPVEARYVRFVPVTWAGVIAMRVEVIGCSVPTPTPVPTTPKQPVCDDDMGFQNGEFSDGQISVSSVYNDMDSVYGKHNVRLNSIAIPGDSAGAWVPKTSSDEYVRFDFLSPSKLTGIVTQGRDASNEFVETYVVRYSPDGKTWSTVTDSNTGKDKVFEGNYDGSTPVQNNFDRVIEARYLEIRPKTWSDNIALRVEVKGCFHPYPEVVTTVPPTTPTSKPPPPYCNACPHLPTDYHKRCYPCQPNEMFDGERCVNALLCPCFHEGIRYPLGSTFETKECEKCECEGNGKKRCEPKKCDPCPEETERRVLTPTCGCVCKPCPENTRLCKSNDFCLEEEKWCDGVEHCPDDETSCPTLAPPECPIPKCPEDWSPPILKVKGDDVNCPIYTCEPPSITTPMSCPPPLCPFGYNIVLVPRKSYEACPRYECEAPPTTLEPYTCPPPTCPDGYDIEIEPESYDQFHQNYGSYDEESYDPEEGCPQYKCVTNAPPTAPCPPPNCPQGYDVSYPQMNEMFSLCPTYECVPIITTTPCPPVECPEGLQTLVIQSEGELCPQFTCIKVTTQPGFTTPALTEMPCREVALPVCKPGEEIYQTNPQSPCPIFKCKKIGAPPPTTEPPKLVRPTCEVKNKDFSTFDGSDFRYEICHHILARDKVSKDWQISLHQHCSKGPCSRFLKVNEGKHNMILGHDLSVSWDGHNYSVPQAQKIGESTGIYSISKVGDAIIFKSKTHKYEVIWNVDNDVKIKLKDEATYQVDGLCGLFSGSPVDDWTKPDGSLSISTKEFGDSWALPDEAPCEEQPKKCSPEENKKAFILCNALDSKPFTECHDVLPVANYLKGCVDRLCVCLKENRTEEECKCGVLASYITACLEKKPDAKVADWRIVTKCYKECPAGEVYNDCFKAPCEKSCETLKDPDMCSKVSDGPCISGCFCEPGLVRKGNACVLPEACRDCICEGYGDPHYKSFDRKNFTFNGECSYVATRDVDPKGEHKFQVITRNKRCRRDPITMCTESVKVLYDSNEIEVLLLPSDNLVTSVNGNEIVNFPMRDTWVAIERPDEDHVMLAIPEIQLEVTYSKDNYGFNVRVPSHLFSGKLEGLCGNCNFDPEDDLKTKNGNVISTVNDFGRSWLVDAEVGTTCQVFTKEEEPCALRHPDEDPCLKLMDEDRFGECHPLEDPVAYVSSCQLDLCLSDEPEKSACQSLEAYARRCAQLDVCLTWRDDELCPKTCPEGLEYMSCGPGCVKTCDNYEELKKDPKSCPISPLDGCYCPGNMILDNNTCVTESSCLTCDSEGHRVGDVWKTDNCTTCECSQDGVSTCRTKSCPIDPICNKGFIIEEIPGTEDECCGPQKTCKIKPTDNCTEPFKPGQSCGYGKLWKLMEYPGLCPQYVCVCLEPEDCPDLVVPSDDDLKPGEEWTLDTQGCCPHYIVNCTGECPKPECQEFYEADVKPLQEGECCPKFTCEPPSDACIHEPHVIVENGFERPLKDSEIPEKGLYKVGEKWLEGLCIECECSLDKNKKPVSKCLRKTCPKKEEHPDRKDYVLEEERMPNTCCNKIVRTACLDDGETFSANQSIYDSLNACRSVECKPNREGRLEKVEQIFSCDEACPLGWEYQPSPLAPMVCCGGCVQIACDHNGKLKELGEVWYSSDYCTVFECIKDKSDKIQTRSKEVQCSVPSDEEKRKYSFSEQKHDRECCLTYTRQQCLIDGRPIPAGQEITDPNDKCISILCESSADGNVTRKEKERACVRNCPLGHVYMEPPSDSEECCGTCFQTQCVDDDKIHLIGDTWENPNDICYQYTCQMRDDVLTVVAIKRECPYFDPECPPSETLRDPTGCCKICNITRETKRECQPEEIDPKDTLDMFVLEARTVGRCTNPRPVFGFKRCSGQCDSKTVFRAQGIDARHISECDCCRPSKLSQIEVVLQCNRGYSFQRVYDNIEACECQPCESGQRDDPYVNDQPLEDLTQFNIPLPNADDPLKS